MADVRTKPKRQAERRRESMALILDHAEAEFARNGYTGTTLARVAELAGIDAALMRYYFGDKERLFTAVFKRRGPASNRLNLASMAAYRAAAGDAMTLEGIIDAFTRPSFQLGVNNPGWRNYAVIVAFVNSSGGWLHKLMSETFDEVSQTLIADLRTVLPDAREQDLYWAYHFLTGAYTFSLGQTERIDTISDGRVASSDFAAIARRLPIVLGAGIRAMCAQGAELDARPFVPMPPGALEDELPTDIL